METRKLIIVTTFLPLLIFLIFFLLKNNRKKSLELGKINKEKKQKLVEENEKLKKDNPEEYQKNITIRKEKLLLKKRKRNISIIVGVLGVLIMGLIKGPPIGYIIIGLIMYLIKKI